MLVLLVLFIAGIVGISIGICILCDDDKGGWLFVSIGLFLMLYTMFVMRTATANFYTDVGQLKERYNLQEYKVRGWTEISKRHIIETDNMQIIWKNDVDSVVVWYKK